MLTPGLDWRYHGSLPWEDFWIRFFELVILFLVRYVTGDLIGYQITHPRHNRVAHLRTNRRRVPTEKKCFLCEDYGLTENMCKWFCA